MRRATTALLIALLLASSAPLAQATPKGVISCINADLSMMPANWNVGDQSCVRVDLGELQPGEIHSFDLTTDLEDLRSQFLFAMLVTNRINEKAKTLLKDFS